MKILNIAFTFSIYFFSLVTLAKTEIITSPSGGDFKLGPINTKELRGKTVFVFFGFTKCPNICPLTMSNLKQMINLLPEPEKDNVRVLFISVDNVRDSNATLAKYVKPFGPQFLSATGPDRSLRKIVGSFGAGYSRFKTSSGKLGVDHNSNIFVINKKGQWTMTLSNNATSVEMMDSIKTANLRTQPPLPEAFEAEWLGENKSCNLSKQQCQIKTKLGTILVDLFPRPVVTQQNIKFAVSLRNSALLPKEADLKAVEYNMGFLRPPLGPDQSGFSGQIRFPVCEQSTMTWIMRLVLVDPNGKYHFAVFHFSTMDPK